MPVPSNPQLSELVAEALIQAGESSADAATVSRATNKWVEEIKNDIWNKSKKLMSLQLTTYGVAVTGQSRYSYPSDYSSDLSLDILDGFSRGIAQAGGSGTITLASTDTSSSNIVGYDILITSGTGVGSLSQVIDYNPSTKVATVVPNFKVAPTTGSGYLIVDKEYSLEQKPMFDFQRFHRLGVGRPEQFFPIGDEDYGEFLLNVAPDKVYGLRLRYYISVMKLDTDSTQMGFIYGKFRNIFLQGLVFKMKKENDDPKYTDEYSLYQRYLSDLVFNETYGMDLSGVTDHVSDYN